MSTSIAPTGAAATGLSIAAEAHAPAAVRNGSTAVKQAYASAQSFEEMLMQQLSQSMLQSSGLGGEGEEGSGEGGSAGEGGMLTSLLPQALTEGVMREGGLGLATQLMRSLDPAAGASASSAAGTGGAAPVQGASGGEVAGPVAAGASVDATGGVAA
jgi:Rod binding domain-containing protein